MKPANARLIFFGTDDFSVPTFNALVAHGYNVVAVVTKPDTTAGRGRQTVEPAIKTAALAHRIQVIQPTKITDILDEIEGLNPDLGVVIAYGKILPQALIDLFPRGLVNIHTSLLPRYRGAAPIEAAILHGDAVTGVTLMQIDAGMDTGPIYAQTEVPLTGHETQADLYASLSELGGTFLTTHLPAILDASLKALPQNNAKASTVLMITKSDGNIDWTEPAMVIERQVRAYCVWPGSHTTLLGSDVIITSASIDESPRGTPGTPFRTEAGELGVATGHGSLIIHRLKPAGKREMTGREFLAGHPLTNEQ